MIAYSASATPNPLRVVTPETNRVLSTNAPEIAISLSNDLEYLGRHDITIRDAAAGERILFGSMENGALNRLVVLQFEAFNEGNEGTYNYNLDGRPVVAGYPWRSNAFAFHMPSARVNNPGGESADSAKFLETQGYTVPDTWLMWRSLTVTDPERKSELIIFYVEFGANHNLSLDVIYENGNSTDVWRGFMPGLERRANANFKLAPLTTDGQANENAWQVIPRYFDAN